MTVSAEDYLAVVTETIGRVAASQREAVGRAAPSYFNQERQGVKRELRGCGEIFAAFRGAPGWKAGVRGYFH